MLQNYVPVVVFFIIAVLLAGLIIFSARIVSWFTKVKVDDDQKLSPYECGFEQFEEPRSRFDVKFYLVAMLFIIFDLEVAFLFPWSVVLHKIGWYGFVAMGLFLLVLVVGFVYEWKKGALEWE